MQLGSRLVRPIGFAALTACLLLTIVQARHWRDSESLYRQAIHVNPASPTAYAGLGRSVALRGDLVLADRYMEQALAINPKSALAHYNRGTLLEQLGKPEEALTWYQQAIELDRGFKHAHVNLGALYMKQGRYGEAVIAFDEALRIERTDLLASFNRGLALEELGRSDEAIAQFRRVLEHSPSHYPSRLKLGMLLAAKGMRRDAMEEFRKILAEQNDPSAHAELAAALIEEGDVSAGLQHYRQALEYESPYWAAIAGRTAWLLATHPSDEVRNGRQAVLLAQEACRITNHSSPELLQTLAAAKAEVGEYADAVKHAEQARARAESLNQTTRLEELTGQLESYRNSRPFRQN
jgi:tetratricopeptide (TPR) repeat protein